MMVNSSNISYGSSVFLLFFLGLLHLLMFRGGILTVIIDKKSPPKLKKKRKMKSDSAELEHIKPYKSLLLWISLKKYKNESKYIIKSKKLYLLAYCYNMLYLIFFTINLISIILGIFLEMFSQLCIYFAYLHIYFFVFPTGTVGFIYMIKNNTNKRQ